MEIWGNVGLWSLFLDYKGITLLGLSGKVLYMPHSFLFSCMHVLHGVMGVCQSTLHVFCGLGKNV